MNQQATLHLFCGKMAAGKSTLAKRLSSESNAILLSEDELLEKLYPGQISDVATYIKCSRCLNTAIEGVVIGCLSSGVSIVLDFPANTVGHRSAFVAWARQSNAKHILHYLDRSDDICKKQLVKRASDQPERIRTDTIEMFEAISQYFEPPQQKEALTIVNE